MSSVMPLLIPLTYFFMLPHSSAFLNPITPTMYDDVFSPPPPTAIPYTPIAMADEQDGEEEGTQVPGSYKAIHLTMADKLRLVQPLLMRYMLPLFAVYLFEYTINQGVSPTLLYNIPSPESHWLLSKIITSLRDYYPLWQLVYQTFVFFSRSSISFGLPPLPARFLPLPSIVQGMIFLVLAYEAAYGLAPYTQGADEWRSIVFVFALVCLEGICGGLAYVNVFYHINHEPPDPNSRNTSIEITRQEREFKIGSIGFADSSGILLASLLAVPTEIQLCNMQAARGKMLCKAL